MAQAGPFPHRELTEVDTPDDVWAQRACDDAVLRVCASEGAYLGSLLNVKLEFGEVG